MVFQCKNSNCGRAHKRDYEPNYEYCSEWCAAVDGAKPRAKLRKELEDKLEHNLKRHIFIPDSLHHEADLDLARKPWGHAEDETFWFQLAEDRIFSLHKIDPKSRAFGILWNRYIQHHDNMYERVNDPITIGNVLNGFAKMNAKHIIRQKHIARFNRFLKLYHHLGIIDSEAWLEIMKHVTDQACSSENKDEE